MDSDRLSESTDLEVMCDSCHGKGQWREEGSGRDRVCGRCDGAGYVTTELGTKILKLIRHNLRHLLESESSLDDQ